MAVVVIYIDDLALAQAAAGRIGIPAGKMVLGQLISRCTPGKEASTAKLAARGLAAKLLPSDSLSVKRDKSWNPSTLVFDTIVPLKGGIRKDEFIARFTQAELDDIFEAQRTFTGNPKKLLDGFIEKIRMLAIVNLDDADIINAVNRLETAGLIGVGRAAEILADPGGFKLDGH